MNRYFVRIILALAALLITELSSYSQEGSLKVLGEADNNFVPLVNAKVSLFQNGKEVKSVYTGSNGKFELDLDLNSEYVIVVEKPGLLSKKIVFNTQVPDNAAKKYTKAFSMGLFPGCEGVNTSALNDPVDRIQYSANKDDFISDNTYFEKMRSRIDKLMNDIQTCEDDKFRNIVREADQLYNSNQLEQSREKYQEALKMRPDDKYSQKRIDNINKKIGNNKEQEEKYNLAINQADQFNASGDYEEAEKKYREALTYQPQNSYPQQKINEIDQKLQAQKQSELNKQALEQKYNENIANGNAAYAAQNYQAAKSYYQQALTLKPDAALPKQKISELDPLIAKQTQDQQAAAANDKEYAEAVTMGQKALQANDLTTARQHFNRALTLKPDASLPKQKIDEIDRTMQQQKQSQLAANEADKQKQINNALDQGDTYFKQKNYEAAAAAYQKALDLDPDDGYAKQRLDRSRSNYESTEAQKQKTLDKAFDDDVKNGDDLVAAGSYDQAVTAYKQALLKKPDDPVVKNKLAQAQSSLDAQKQKQLAEQENKNNYQQYLAQANSLFDAKNYQQARDMYSKAQNIFPDQAAPRNRIKEIDNIISAKQKDKMYNNYIASADKFLASKDYVQAKNAYQQALSVKPNDQYATRKISDIDNTVKENAALASKQQALDQQYSSAVSQADKLFAQGNLTEAKNYYQQASAAKPEEAYPKDQINKIDAQIAENQRKESEQNAKDQQYNDLIGKADASFSQSDLKGAQTLYQQAQQIKPAESYPASQLAKINNMLAQQVKSSQEKAAFEQKYNAIINQADNAYNSKNFETAKANYQKALDMKPDESYPKERLKKIYEYERMMAAQQARQNTSTVSQSTEQARKQPVLPELKFANDAEKNTYLNKLKMKYPKGVTLEVYKEKNKVTKRYIVIRDGEAKEFRQVNFSWGGVEYRLNGILITSQYFDQQVKARKGEYFKEIDF